MLGSLWRASRSDRRRITRALRVGLGAWILAFIGVHFLILLVTGQSLIGNESPWWHLPASIMMLAIGASCFTVAAAFLFVRPHHFTMADKVSTERRIWYTPHWVQYLDSKWVYRTFFAGLGLTGAIIVLLTFQLFG